MSFQHRNYFCPICNKPATVIFDTDLCISRRPYNEDLCEHFSCIKGSAVIFRDRGDTEFKEAKKMEVIWDSETSASWRGRKSNKTSKSVSHAALPDKGITVNSSRQILLDRMLDAADWARKLGLDPLELMRAALAELDRDAMIVVNKMPKEVEANG